MHVVPVDQSFSQAFKIEQAFFAWIIGAAEGYSSPARPIRECLDSSRPLVTPTPSSKLRHARNGSVWPQVTSDGKSPDENGLRPNQDKDEVSSFFFFFFSIELPGSCLID